MKREGDLIFKRDKTIVKIRLEGSAALTIDIVCGRGRFCRIAAHQPVGLLGIEVANALGVRVCDDCVGVIPNHFRCIAIPCRIDWQKSALGAGRHQRLNHLTLSLWIEDGQQRMQGAEGVPNREIGVVGEVLRRFDGASPTESGVVAVYVAEGSWQQQGMIEGGIEDAPLRSVPGNLDGSKGLFPLRSRGGSRLIEVPIGDFVLQIATRFLNAGKRGSYSDL